MALTKIIVTVGPAIEKENVLGSIIKAGASVFRFNLKYNTPSWHNLCIQRVKRVAKRIGRPVAILLDFPNFARKISLNREYLLMAKREEVDFLALSFVRRKEDIDFWKRKIKEFSLSAKILAKIEAKEALVHFEEILDCSDGMMVARGDLGEEIPFEEVPYYQKKIIKRCLELGKPVIVATQMLESMIKNPLPTRAEVSDVANSILDYTDAVMLSEETALGRYPLKAVSVMEKICRFWEKKRPPVSGFNFKLEHQTSAVCYSAYQMWRSPFCQREKIRAFVLLTKKGMSAHMLSRLRPDIPILALTPDRKLRDRLCLLYGVLPLVFEEERESYRKRNSVDIKKILMYAKNNSQLKKGEKVILLYAEDWGTLGKTNIIRIQEVP